MLQDRVRKECRYSAEAFFWWVINCSSWHILSAGIAQASSSHIGCLYTQCTVPLSLLEVYSFSVLAVKQRLRSSCTNFLRQQHCRLLRV